MRRTAIAAFLIMFIGVAVAAETANTPTPAPKAKAAKPTAVPTGARMPAMEKLSCRTGPNDEQVRLTVIVVKGRPMEFAFYSRLGTKVCSIHGRRGDAYTKWADDAGAVQVKLLEGRADLKYDPGHLTLKFYDVGRMRFCGMYGQLNGVVEVFSKKSECTLVDVFKDGVVDEGPVEKEAGEKGAVEKAAVDKAAVEKGAGEKGLVEKGAGEKGAVEKGAGEKGAGEKSVEKGPDEMGAVEKGVGEKAAIEK